MKRFPLPVVLFLLLAGCAVPESTGPRRIAEMHAFELADALSVAQRARLDADIVEILGRIATEHMENRMLLQFPALCREVRSGRRLTSQEEYQLLDDAIAYNFLMAPGRTGEPARLYRKRAGQLLQLEEAHRWIRLGAVLEKLQAAGDSPPPELLRQRDELKMLLRIRNGIDNRVIEAFDFSSLVEPHEFFHMPDELQRYTAAVRSESGVPNFPHGLAAQLRVFYRHDPAAVPMLAEALYRLPRKLEELRIAESGEDLLLLSNLGSALGCTIETELSLRRLQQAWEDWRTNPSPDTRAAWQGAFYRLMVDLGVADLSALPGSFVIPAAPPVGEAQIRLLLELMRI